MCRDVYGPRLQRFQDINGVYDFDAFLKCYRPKAADRNIQQQFSTDFELRTVDGTHRVFVRSKPKMGDKTKWSEWYQMYPSLLDARGHRPHRPAVIPPTADNKEWEDFDNKIVPSLLP